MGIFEHKTNSLNKLILSKITDLVPDKEFTRQINQVEKISSQQEKKSQQIELIANFLKKHEEYYLTILSLIKNNKDINIMIQNIEEIHTSLSTLDPKGDVYIATSVIIGAFLGDAMGSFCEFTKRGSSNSDQIWNDRNVFGLPKGHLTDDSEMALSLCYAIMDGKSLNSLSQHLIYYYYGLWFLSSPPDIGTTTANSLSAIDFKNEFKISNEDLFNNAKNTIQSKVPERNLGDRNAKATSLSNGFLMRISPIAVWFYFKEKLMITESFQSNRTVEDFKPLYSKILAETKKDTLITHMNSTESTTAAALYIFLILNCMIQDTPEIILENMITLLENFICESEDDDEREGGIQFLNTINRVKCNKDIHGEKYYELSKIDGQNMGFYLHAIRCTFFYLRHFDGIKSSVGIENMYRNIMNEICNLGGDTDTNCCIVGAVLGPLIGMNNFGSEVSDLVKYVDENRMMYSTAIAVEYIRFLKETFSYGEKPLDEKEYRFNFLKILLKVLN